MPSICVTCRLPGFREVNTAPVARGRAEDKELQGNKVSHYRRFVFYLFKIPLDSFSFERIDYGGDLSHFWRSIGLALEAGLGHRLNKLFFMLFSEKTGIKKLSFS